MRRPSTYAFALIGLLTVLLVAVFGMNSVFTAAHLARIDANRALVTQLGLTDLALFTEARYTRHLSQADLHSALQDHPGAFEHFPSGSLIAPPAHLTRPRLIPHEPVAGKTASPD